MSDLELALRNLVRDEVKRLSGGDDSANRLITVEAAAQLASVRPSTIRSWIACGRIPARRAGKRLRVRAADVLAALTENCPRARRSISPEELAKRAVQELRRQPRPMRD